MADVAEILGKAVEAKDPLVAVVRCSGSPEHRQRVKTNTMEQHLVLFLQAYIQEKQDVNMDVLV